MNDGNLAIINDEAQAPMAIADPMVAMIERVVMAPELPMERIEALMNMRDRQMRSEAEQAFNLAFAAAMSEMPDVKRSGKNTHLKNSYSTLDDLIRATRPVLSRHGLSLNWQTAIDGNNISVTATVRHARGHCISTTLAGPRDSGKQMNALQGGGSTETYLKRYTGFAILGLSSGDERDDDGLSANSLEKITADQFIELRSKAEKAGVSEATICKAHGIESLEDMLARDVAGAISRLEINIKRNSGDVNV